jgi:hypothetical protein
MTGHRAKRVLRGALNVYTGAMAGVLSEHFWLTATSEHATRGATAEALCSKAGATRNTSRTPHQGCCARGIYALSCTCK